CVNLRINPARLDFLVTCYRFDTISSVKQRGNRFALCTSRFALREGRSLSSDLCPLISQKRNRFRGFTLLELLVVIAIIAVLMVLVAPAFTNIKSGNDITTAAYTIKGVLAQARTYAQANNTYTWVGFYEEDGSRASTNPATAGSGRLVLSIVASKDGTNIYRSGSGTIDCTKLSPVGALVKIDNVHLPLLAIGSDTGDTFDARPALQFDPTAGYNYSRFGELNGTT